MTESSPAVEYLRYKLLLPTLLFCTGLAAGSLLAVARAQSIPVYAAQTGVSCTLVGGTYVVLRQAGLGLVHLQRGMRDTPHIDTETDAKDERRTIVCVSGGAGTITGAAFNLFRRGTRGLAGAALLYGGLAATGQFSLFAASDARLAFIAARHPSPASASTQDDSAQTRAETAKATTRVKEADKSVWQKLRESSPLRRMPDAEYEAMLGARIDELGEQLARVDEEMRLAREELAAR